MTERSVSTLLAVLLAVLAPSAAQADVLLAGHRIVDQVVADDLGFATMGDGGVLMTWTADDIEIQAWTQLDGAERIATSGTHVLAVTSSSAVLYERRTLRQIEELSIAGFTECVGANGIWYWADDLIQYVGTAGRIELDFPDDVPLERALCAVDGGRPTLAWYEDGRAYGVWPTPTIDPLTAELVEGAASEPSLISSAPWTHPADPVAIWADDVAAFLPVGESTSLATSSDGARSITLEPPRRLDPTECARSGDGGCFPVAHDPFTLAAGIRPIGAAASDAGVLIVEEHGWATIAADGDEPMVERHSAPSVQTLAWGMSGDWILSCTSGDDGSLVELSDPMSRTVIDSEPVDSCDVRVFSGSAGTSVASGRVIFDVQDAGELRRWDAGTSTAATPVIAGTTQRFVLSAVHDPACGQRAVELRRQFADGDEAWLSGPLCASDHWLVPFVGPHTEGFAVISQSPSRLAVEVWSWSGEFIQSETHSADGETVTLADPRRVRAVEGSLQIDDVSARASYTIDGGLPPAPLWLAPLIVAEPNGLAGIDGGLRVWVLGDDALIWAGGDLWCSEPLRRMLVVTDRDGEPRSFVSNYVQNRWDAQLLERIAFP